MSTKDKGLRQLLQLPTRTVLQTAANSRLALGIRCDCVMVQANSNIAKSMTAEGVAFAAAVDARRRQMSKGETAPPPLGPPTLHMFMGLLEGLVKEDCGSANREKISQYLTNINECADPTAPGSEVADMVMACKITTVYDKDKKRVILAMQRGELRTAVLTALMAVSGNKILTGSAPASFVEEEFEEWLDLLAKQQ